MAAQCATFARSWALSRRCCRAALRAPSPVRPLASVHCLCFALSDVTFNRAGCMIEGLEVWRLLGAVSSECQAMVTMYLSCGSTALHAHRQQGLLPTKVATD